MKKTYKAPTLDVVILKAQMAILAGSNEQVSIGDPYSGGGVGGREDDNDW